LHRQHQAARHDLPVHVDGAGAAVAGAAAFLGAGEAHVLAQGVEEGHVGLDEHLDRLAVHGAAQDLSGHWSLPPDQAFARSRAVVSVRRVRTRTRCLRNSTEPRWSLMGLAASMARPAARSMASGVTAWPSSDRSAAVARTG